MPVNQGRLRARVLDRLRKRHYGNASIQVLSGPKIPYVPEATYGDGWDLVHIEHVPTGADYFELFIMDLDGSRAAVLSKASAFALAGYVYKRSAADPPKGTIPEWVYKLQHTGQRI